jgi:hypothetical protein
MIGEQISLQCEKSPGFITAGGVAQISDHDPQRPLTLLKRRRKAHQAGD